MSFVQKTKREFGGFQNDLKSKNTDYLHIRCDNQFYSSLCVPETFSREVLLHVISLYLPNNTFFVPPMFLAIEGEPGEGKTVQTIATCIQHGIDILYISASQLSGAQEGDSIEIMDKIYAAALAMRQSTKRVALLIDDFHLGSAIYDKNVTCSINSNLLTGYLMNLADDNTKAKVPIILTGNDYSKVYAPLLRSGRADKFIWAPGYEEKKLIIKNIFSTFVQEDSDEFDKFFDKYSSGNVADFSQLKNDYRKFVMNKFIGGMTIFDNESLETISENLNKYNKKVDYVILEELAQRRFKKRI
ncbi:MAG TPA: AAA family ATPase [Clostridiales bacterium]|nr:AAA family ATPase [Clostridiales bacterium]